MKKHTILIFSPILIFILGICCKQSKNSLSINENKIENHFFGDSILSKNNYFETLVKGNDKSFLKKQNEKYLTIYSHFKNDSSFISEDISIKLIKEELHDENNIKVNLFTYKGKEKVDSIQFYRNISGEGFGTYNCLSYYNKQTNKIWQIKYFPLNPLRANLVGIVSYTESSFTSDGKFKLDSLHYLDESLDLEMEKYNLYY